MERLPRTALVTGGARRVGAAMSRALAEDGFFVAVHCHRSLDAARALVAEIEAAGGRAAVFEADLSCEPAVAALASEVIAAAGPIGVLVNNASCFARDRTAESPAELWQRVIAVDLRAPLVLAGALVRALPADAEALIVNMVDARIVNPTPNYLSYTAAKSGLWAATQVMARDLAPRIRTVAIAPGLVLAPDGEGHGSFEQLVAASPLRRPVPVSDLVAGLRFAMRCSSLTGSMLLLDGGQHMGWLTPRGAQSAGGDTFR